MNEPKHPHDDSHIEKLLTRVLDLMVFHGWATAYATYQEELAFNGRMPAWRNCEASGLRWPSLG